MRRRQLVAWGPGAGARGGAAASDPVGLRGPRRRPAPAELVRTGVGWSWCLPRGDSRPPRRHGHGTAASRRRRTPRPGHGGPALRAGPGAPVPRGRLWGSAGGPGRAEPSPRPRPENSCARARAPRGLGRARAGPASGARCAGRDARGCHAGLIYFYFLGSYSLQLAAAATGCSQARRGAPGRKRRPRRAGPREPSAPSRRDQAPRGRAGRREWAGRPGLAGPRARPARPTNSESQGFGVFLGL